jgi:hypothetical protein
MDNMQFDMTSEGNQRLADLFKIVFGDRMAVGYAVRHGEPGKRWDPDKYLKDPRDRNLLEWHERPKDLRLVFFWTNRPNQADYIALPFKMDAAGAADFAARWLSEADYGREPDHDGDNGKGWRAYSEGWGHVDSDYAAFIAVSPRWAMYGK